MATENEGTPFAGRVVVRVNGKIVEFSLAPGSIVYRGLPVLKRAIIESAPPLSADEVSPQLPPPDQRLADHLEGSSQKAMPENFEARRAEGIRRDALLGIPHTESLFDLLPSTSTADFAPCTSAVRKLGEIGARTVTELSVTKNEQIMVMWSISRHQRTVPFSYTLALLMRDVAVFRLSERDPTKS